MPALLKKTGNLQPGNQLKPPLTMPIPLPNFAPARSYATMDFLPPMVALQLELNNPEPGRLPMFSSQLAENYPSSATGSGSAAGSQDDEEDSLSGLTSGSGSSNADSRGSSPADLGVGLLPSSPMKIESLETYRREEGPVVIQIESSEDDSVSQREMQDEEDDGDSDEGEGGDYDEVDEDDGFGLLLPPAKIASSIGEREAAAAAQVPKRRRSYNDKILKLKCSRAFALVEDWENVDEFAAGRCSDTFYPLAVVFARCVRDNVGPPRHSERIDGHLLKDCLQVVLEASSKPLDGSIEWLPHGDEPVSLVLEKACFEVYVEAGRATQLSEPYVEQAVKKAARKLIGSCVRICGGGTGSTLAQLSALLTQETVNLKIAVALATARVTEDPDYVRDCENHAKIAKRVLIFE